MNSNSTQPAGPSRENVSTEAQDRQGQAPQFVPFQPGQAPTSFFASAAMPIHRQTPQFPAGYGYPPTFQYPPSMVPSPFSPYPSSVVPTIPSIASPMQSPMQPTPIPVPGNPGLFYIPQAYEQSQPVSHPPYVSLPGSKWLETSAPPEDSPVEPEVAPTPMQEEPFWCFQCQQWHKSKEAQDQAHAAFQPQASPRPAQAQPNTQGVLGTNEGDLAVKMSQAIKEAVAAEFASRNIPPRGAYQDAVAEHKQHSNTEYSPRTPAGGLRRQGREWGDEYEERSRNYGQHSRGYGERPRDYGERSRDYEDHYGYGLDYKEDDSRQRRYRAAYEEQSRSSTPSDARAWRDANTDLDPDDIRAETDSMVSAAFSDMTIQDYKRDGRGNNRSTNYKSYGAEESSSEANGSEEDTGLPLKYLPSPYPNMSTPKKSSYSQSNSNKTRGESKRSELDRQRAPTATSEEAQLPQIAARRHHRGSFQDDETLKQRPYGENPPRGTQQWQPKVEKAIEDSKTTFSKTSNTASKTAPPSAAEAQAAVLAYAQWYAQTYGVDPSFITNLQSSIASTSSVVSLKSHERHNISSKKTSKRVPSLQPSEASTEAHSVANTDDSQAPSEDDTSLNGGYSASEHSLKSENTVKRGGPKHRSNQESATSSLRGGRTGYSSPASSENLEPLMRYLKQTPVKSLVKAHLLFKAKTLESDTADVKKEARKVTQPAIPPAKVITPVKPEVEPSLLVLERSRRQYSLVRDEDSQALKPVVAAESTSTSAKKGEGVKCGHLNRENETSPTTERVQSIPEYAKPEESNPRAKEVEAKNHPGVDRTYLTCKPTRSNDPIPTAENVRLGKHGQKLAHGSKFSIPTQSRPKPMVENVPDDYDTRRSEGLTWDEKLSGYVNRSPNMFSSSSGRFTVDTRESENDYPQSELRATQTPCGTERGHGGGDAEISAFDFQVEKFSDDERHCIGGEQNPGDGKHNEDDWEDEELEENTEYASESEESYTDEVILELLSNGRYSDVVSGIFSDVDTEVTTFPGAYGDRVVGAPRDMRTQNSYETGRGVGSRNQQEGAGCRDGRKCRREGGERQMEGGNSYGSVYFRRDGREVGQMP